MNHSYRVVGVEDHGTTLLLEITLDPSYAFDDDDDDDNDEE